MMGQAVDCTLVGKEEGGVGEGTSSGTQVIHAYIYICVLMYKIVSNLVKWDR